jgi:hypothetical protein
METVVSMADNEGHGLLSTNMINVSDVAVNMFEDVG